MVLLGSLLLGCLATSICNADLIRAPIKRYESDQTLQKRQADGYYARLYNVRNSFYVIPLAVGTPAQNFSVTLDTGSADLWITSSTCSATVCASSGYDVSASNTASSTGTQFDITYGTGSAQGIFYTDTVSVGLATLKNQMVGLASSTSIILASTTGSDPQTSGMIGLGYPALTSASYSPFVFQLSEQNLISSPVFSIYLNQTFDSAWVGEIIFGGYDSSFYTGNLLYSAVTQTPGSGVYSYWMVQGVSISINNQSFNFSEPNPNVVIDTGSTLSYFSTANAESLVEAAVGAENYAFDSTNNAYVVPCSNNTTSANSTLSVVMGGVTLTIPVANLIIPYSKNTNSDYECMFGIAPNISSQVNYIVGQSILRSTYLVFDMGENRIGFAASKGSGASVLTNTFATSGGPMASIPSPALLFLSIAMACVRLF